MRYRLIRNSGRRWNVWENPPVRAAELELAIRQSLELEAFFMDSAVMAAAQQREIRERRGPALSPVADMMTFADSHHAARESAAAVPVVERAP